MSDRSENPLLINTEGHAECLLGNEAIVRGALEAGVTFAAGYPGTPSSEITDSFAQIADAFGLEFEYSVNEKIALEMAFASSLAGGRSICAMKHLGLMVAGDPLSTIPYVGVEAGMVVVSAGDPSCRTSPNEQDQRYLAPMLHLPMLDPSTPQEAYEMARFAFELSEQCKLPVILRTTTRVCHTRGVIHYHRLRTPQVTGFTRRPERYVPIPSNARKLRLQIKGRLKIAEDLLARSPFLRFSGKGELCILASGVPAAICADLLPELGIQEKVRLLTLNCVYPLPRERILKSLQGVRRVLVVEELSPYLEDTLMSWCHQDKLPCEVFGKRSGHFPEEFEYDSEIIRAAIRKVFDLGTALKPPVTAPQVPPRPPTLCPGCPHRATQFALRAVFGEESLYFNDIGCYTLGYGPPLNTADALLCMGAGFTLASGVSRVTHQRTVGIMGDSTFFHSGMPALLNAIKENVNMVAVILDNQVTAMTGFQESPGITVVKDHLQRNTSIEGVVRALGCQQVEKVDPYDLPSTIAALQRAKGSSGVSVVIAERPCPVFLSRQTNQPYKIGTYEVVASLCRSCGREKLGLRCDTCGSERFYRQRTLGQLTARDDESECCPDQAPCSLRCPLRLCVQGYIGHVAAGQYQEAFHQIMSQLPLPESVCRVCDRPCERVCVRAETDESVAINDLKRFVIDWAVQQGIPYSPKREAPLGKKVAVVGAGPAGLAAAHDLWLRGFEVTLFDSEEKPGGLLRYGIPAYRLPRESLDRDIERILGLGVRFVPNQTLGKNLMLKELTDQYAAVVLSMGAWKEIRLGLKAEGRTSAAHLLEALPFLKAVNLGQKIQLGRRVAVIGGGNAAIDAARTAKRLGATQVLVVYRRRREEMPAIVGEILAAEEEGIEIRPQLHPVRLSREGLICQRTQAGPKDSSGRSQPIPVPDSELTIPADQIVAAVGQTMDETVFLESDLVLARNPDGSIQTDLQSGQTSVAKIFVAGDLGPEERTVTSAIASGKRAAWGVDRYLGDLEKANQLPLPPRGGVQAASIQALLSPAKKIGRVHPNEMAPSDRTSDFREVVSSFTEDQAKSEAERCLSCGQCGNCRTCLDLFGCPAFFLRDEQIAIDPALCMGCGICAHICPNHAIQKGAPELNQETGGVPSPRECTGEVPSK